MINKIIISLIILISLNGNSETLKGKCIKVLDGDTIKVEVNNKEESIRMAYIDAPEKNQEYGQESKEYLRNLVENEDVIINVKSKDRYNRYIGEVYLGECNVNEQMIISGNAWIYTQYMRERILDNLETEAIKNGVGLWGHNPTPPWEFRKSRKNRD